MKQVNYSCPNCKSTNTKKSDKINTIVGWLLFFFALPLPLYKKEYHCFDCLTDFKIHKKASKK